MHGLKHSKWGGELPYPTQTELCCIRDDWMSWELLSRGILLGSFGGMEPQDIANVCGYPCGAGIRKKSHKAMEKIKATQAV
jgi:hypothetical protein